jgi:3-hydroxyacyl-[acyl-carrier-protein] dehydratase
MILTPKEVLQLVPQQNPFRFIDTIYNSIEDASILCSYTFKEDEPFYKGHFPGNPLTPGVILIEAAAQMSVVAHGIWLVAKECNTKEQISEYTTFFSGIDSAEFLKPVLPGEKVTVYGKLLVWKRKRIKHEVTMKNNSGEIVMNCVLGGFGVKK